MSFMHHEIEIVISDLLLVLSPWMERRKERLSVEAARRQGGNESSMDYGGLIRVTCKQDLDCSRFSDILGALMLEEYNSIQIELRGLYGNFSTESFIVPRRQ